MLEKAREICNVVLIRDSSGSTSVSMTKVLGKLDCRVALHLANLEKKGFEGVEYVGLQAIADAFNTDMRLLDPSALELNFSGSEDPKTVPSTPNEAADVPDVRASATKSVEEMNFMLILATGNKYKVGGFVKSKSRPADHCKVKSLSDDFCELIKHEFVDVR